MSILVAVMSAVCLVACQPIHQNTSDEVQRQAQEQLSEAGNSTVGMPAITQFAEKRMMKDILELRDQMKPTITYLVGMNGDLHKMCDSVGYGLSGGTQYTNPQRVAKYTETPEHGNITLPQADPNGLFSPATAEGTYVMCVNPKTGKAEPIYSEPRVIVSPFPLQ